MAMAAAASGSGSVGIGKVLVVAGTHGNERNAPWLLQQPVLAAAAGLPGSVANAELALVSVIGNPEAFAANTRYLDRDLNRSFEPGLLADPHRPESEVERARALISSYGPQGLEPCLVALDLHSTTAAMGSSLVVYGRRPADLALAAGIQQALGLPIYLHEADARQSGFLVERWLCGLAIEVGPVPQGVLTARVIRQTRLALEESLKVLAAARQGACRLPRKLVVHRHRLSLDVPRHSDGSPAAVIHPQRQGRDWQPLSPGDPLFLAADGGSLPFVPPEDHDGSPFWPVFINEAAYGEKGIALTLTQREVWMVEPAWLEALQRVAAGLLPQSANA